MELTVHGSLFHDSAGRKLGSPTDRSCPGLYDHDYCTTTQLLIMIMVVNHMHCSIGVLGCIGPTVVSGPLLCSSKA